MLGIKETRKQTKKSEETQLVRKILTKQSNCKCSQKIRRKKQPRKVSK